MSRSPGSYDGKKIGTPMHLTELRPPPKQRDLERAIGSFLEVGCRHCHAKRGEPCTWNGQVEKSHWERREGYKSHLAAKARAGTLEGRIVSAEPIGRAGFRVVRRYGA